jgi:hypothetical protein
MHSDAGMKAFRGMVKSANDCTKTTTAPVSYSANFSFGFEVILSAFHSFRI